MKALNAIILHYTTENYSNKKSLINLAFIIKRNKFSSNLTNEECYSTACSNDKNVLDISIDGVVISLLVKYYVPLANINKVIKILKIQSTVNLQWTSARGPMETKHTMVFRLRLALKSIVNSL